MQHARCISDKTKTDTLSSFYMCRFLNTFLIWLQDHAHIAVAYSAACLTVACTDFSSSCRTGSRVCLTAWWKVSVKWIHYLFRIAHETYPTASNCNLILTTSEWGTCCSLIIWSPCYIQSIMYSYWWGRCSMAAVTKQINKKQSIKSNTILTIWRYEILQHGVEAGRSRRWIEGSYAPAMVFTT
jgi:hypothetical protein